MDGEEEVECERVEVERLIRRCGVGLV